MYEKGTILSGYYLTAAAGSRTETNYANPSMKTTQHPRVYVRIFNRIDRLYIFIIIVLPVLM